MPGLTENVRIISVIGRFLEHSRIFYFQDGRKTRWPASTTSARPTGWNATCRPGGGDHADRVAAVRERLWEILEMMRNDQRQAWDMKADGSYVLRTPPAGATGQEAIGTHQTLMNLTRQRLETAWGRDEQQTARRNDS